jgi:hypothetical protein
MFSKSLISIKIIRKDALRSKPLFWDSTFYILFVNSAFFMYLTLAFLILLVEHSHKLLDASSPSHRHTLHSESVHVCLLTEKRTKETEGNIEG